MKKVPLNNTFKHKQNLPKKNITKAKENILKKSQKSNTSLKKKTNLNESWNSVESKSNFNKLFKKYYTTNQVTDTMHADDGAYPVRDSDFDPGVTDISKTDSVKLTHVALQVSENREKILPELHLNNSDHSVGEGRGTSKSSSRQQNTVEMATLDQLTKGQGPET